MKQQTTLLNLVIENSLQRGTQIEEGIENYTTNIGLQLQLIFPYGTMTNNAWHATPNLNFKENYQGNSDSKGKTGFEALT